MPREKKIIIKNYQNFWTDDLPDGHQIRIAHGSFSKPKLLVLDLHWPDRNRDKGGRVTTYYDRK
jgi:hypothetical protein|tara:strand:+ start:662 stop:853 length:192 start_codon:yes stop_codon:yes gene_type:complete